MNKADKRFGLALATLFFILFVSLGMLVSLITKKPEGRKGTVIETTYCSPSERIVTVRQEDGSLIWCSETVTEFGEFVCGACDVALEGLCDP